MRISLVLAASLGAAALFTVAACQPEDPSDVKGTVIEKEHKPRKQGTIKRVCPTPRPAPRKGKTAGASRPVCTTRTTGTRAECYQLEIRTEDNSVVEVCDKAAFMALNVDDVYDSAQDYAREDQ